MKNKIKITAVAGVAVCSMVSVANASEVKSLDINASSEYKTLETQQAAHPYEAQLDLVVASISKFNPLGNEFLTSAPKRFRHAAPEDRSIWQKLFDWITPSSSSDGLL